MAQATGDSTRHVFHRGRGGTQVFGLGACAVVQGIVAVFDATGGMGHVIGAIAHLHDDVAELRVHGSQGGQQDADLVVPADVDAGTQRPARDVRRHLGGLAKATTQ